MDTFGIEILLEWWAWFYVIIFFIGTIIFVLPAFGLAVWIFSLFRRGKPMPWRRIRQTLAGVLLVTVVYAFVRLVMCLSDTGRCIGD